METNVSDADVNMLARDGVPALAFRKRDGTSPTLVFLPGYASDMEGAKAQAIDAFGAMRGLGVLRFDYSGTGASQGRFEDGTLDGWLADSLDMIKARTDGPLILIGSSMGGWLALHIALRMPQRVAGIVGIAAAPDFTEWGFDAAQRAELETAGRFGEVDEGRYFTHGFWRSGQRMLLLESEIACDCPVRLVHGDADTDVPLDVAMRLKDRLRSADVQLTIVKGGGHRLSEPHEIHAILRAVDSLLEHRP
jgi:pimeloyl-ACP methyl ester carboxylesterase